MQNRASPSADAVKLLSLLLIYRYIVAYKRRNVNSNIVAAVVRAHLDYILKMVYNIMSVTISGGEI